MYDPIERSIAEYMAKIDTRIDRIVLEWRLTDEFIDAMAGKRGPIAGSREAMWERFRVDRIAASHTEITHRPDDLQALIEEIRASDGFTIPAERAADIGFGRYDGNDDKYLAMVLDYAGPDFADEETGDTEWGEHVMRFDRVLMGTNDQGFRSIAVFDTEDAAKAMFEALDYQYALDTREMDDN
jgi:hypothetical protein